MSDKAKHPDRGDSVTVANAQTTLPFSPLVFGDASAWSEGVSVLPVFEIEISAATDVDLTLAQLLGGYDFSQAIASDDVDTVDFTNNELDVTTHGLETGDGPIQFTTTDTLPTGLALLTDYWVIKVNAGTIKVAASLADAAAGTAVPFSDVGAGTHTFEGASAITIKWFEYGNLGKASDGAVSLLTKKGYTNRVNHRPRTKYYAVTATLSSAVAVSVSLHAVQDIN